MTNYDDIAYNTAHEDCAECIECLTRLPDMMKRSCAGEIWTFSATGGHYGSVSRG